MKLQVYAQISIRIILLFATGMFGTFIPAPLHEFFGDKPMTHSQMNSEMCDINWDWGARHYWYYWMMFFLFILSLISFIMSIVKILKKNYN